jgi:hypothetical protein
MIAAHTPKTKQELFDFVLAAIRKQGRPSMNGAHCMYRAADGARCAAGHLIRDGGQADWHRHGCAPGRHRLRGCAVPR